MTIITQLPLNEQCTALFYLILTITYLDSGEKLYY